MPKAIVLYVQAVDAVSYRVGRLAMYLIFAMIGLLLLSSLSRVMVGASFIWVVEIAQFMLAAYYILGGGYSMMLQSHVRMDLIYGLFSERGKAIIDAVTSLCLITYLVVLLMGATSSTLYAIEYGQKNYSTWGPQLWPIKVIMTFGIALMLLQTFSMLFKDIAKARGRPIA